MIALSIFLCAFGLLFFALVEMAFTLLMRLPQRLEAERASHDDALAAYLEDPLKFFVPARLLRGVMLVVLFVACSLSAWIRLGRRHDSRLPAVLGLPSASAST